MKPDPEAAAPVQEKVEELCRKHGSEWPYGNVAHLAQRFAVSRQSIQKRKRITLARPARAGRQEVA